MYKIIGIDPGFAGTGVGVVSGTGIRVQDFAYGSIETLKGMPVPQRLQQIFTKISKVLADERPDLMVVEDVFSLGAYPKSGILLGKVSGVILLAGCQMNVAVIEVPVREAKQVLTGNGNASKEQLERCVRQTLNLKAAIRPFHAADALGLALIGMFRYAQPRSGKD